MVFNPVILHRKIDPEKMIRMHKDLYVPKRQRLECKVFIRDPPWLKCGAGC